MTRTSITITTEIDLDVVTGAAWFWGLNDEEQAQFLIEIEKVSRRDCYPNSAGMQWCNMIGHLNTCECSNDHVRQMVKDWADYLEHTAPQPQPRAITGEFDSTRSV